MLPVLKHIDLLTSTYHTYNNSLRTHNHQVGTTKICFPIVQTPDFFVDFRQLLAGPEIVGHIQGILTFHSNIPDILVLVCPSCIRSYTPRFLIVSLPGWCGWWSLENCENGHGTPSKPPSKSLLVRLPSFTPTSILANDISPKKCLIRLDPK